MPSRLLQYQYCLWRAVRSSRLLAGGPRRHGWGCQRLSPLAAEDPPAHHGAPPDSERGRQGHHEGSDEAHHPPVEG